PEGLAQRGSSWWSPPTAEPLADQPAEAAADQRVEPAPDQPARTDPATSIERPARATASRRGRPLNPPAYVPPGSSPPPAVADEQQTPVPTAPPTGPGRRRRIDAAAYVPPDQQAGDPAAVPNAGPAGPAAEPGAPRRGRRAAFDAPTYVPPGEGTAPRPPVPTAASEAPAEAAPTDAAPVEALPGGPGGGGAAELPPTPVRGRRRRAAGPVVPASDTTAVGPPESPPEPVVPAAESAAFGAPEPSLERGPADAGGLLEPDGPPVIPVEAPARRTRRRSRPHRADERVESAEQDGGREPEPPTIPIPIGIASHAAASGDEPDDEDEDDMVASLLWRDGPDVPAEIDDEQREPRRHWWQRRNGDQEPGHDPFGQAPAEDRPVVPMQPPPGAHVVPGQAVEPAAGAAAGSQHPQVFDEPTPAHRQSAQPEPETVDLEPVAAEDAETAALEPEAAAPEVAEPEAAASLPAESVVEPGPVEVVAAQAAPPAPVADWQPPTDWTFPGRPGAPPR
ncbi:MAG: hypothetical protein QOG80_2481, partial [Pseudonocardiales bacterium]|nr:hypothetical protein [Pseudonocardiales bacterium]